LFLFRLAGHLGRTVAEIEETMTSSELSEWMAFDLYCQPLDNGWRQAGVIAAASVAPHCGKGKAPKPDDFVPIARLPQSPEDMAAELAKLKTLTGG
jgi:hypothetical protein